jgi:hypothetical protein
MPHRPLSAWVSAVPLTTAGVAQWDLADDVNFGDERADARALPQFAAAWRRQAVPVDLGYAALGLVREHGMEAVLELDDLACPVRVTPVGAEIIARVENEWPDGGVSPAEAVVLAGEEFAVRDLLLTRLAVEGDPPPELFHILPWHLVDQLAGDVMAMLGGAPPTPDIVELEHWFASTGSRFTAALEQLDEGLRRRDTELIRVAGSALCARLLTVTVSRLPLSTRQALAALAATLPGQDPFLAFAATRAAARLRGDESRSRPPLRLETRLPAAAADTPGVRISVKDGVREPFTLRLAVTGRGRVEVSLRAPVESDIGLWLSESYGVLLQPVTIRGSAESVRYLIALGYARDEVFGAISVPVPRGPFVEADVDGVPLGAAEVRALSPDEVERSIGGLRTNSAGLPWRRLRDRLPAGHPLRAVIGPEAQ